VSRVVLLFGSITLAVLEASGLALAQTISCAGGLCLGTNKQDIMTGSTQRDTMKGLEMRARRSSGVRSLCACIRPYRDS
jgi:hypothetical protein